MHRNFNIPREGRAARSSERGSALILALLCIIALTGLGLVGLKHTRFELRQANNNKFKTQAQYTAEAGLMAAMHRVGENGQVFWDYLDRIQTVQRRELGQVNTVEYPLSSGEFLTSNRVFGGGESSFENEQGTDATFNVVFRDPRDGPRPAGFSKEFCFKRFTFISTGRVGEAGDENNLRWNDAVRTSSSRTISHAMVGPLLCDEGFGQ